MTTPSAGSGLTRRLIAAVVVGVVVAVASYFIAFAFLRNHYEYLGTAWATRLNMQGIAKVVEDHRERTGQYPARLADIADIQGVFREDADGRPIDYFGHPIQYAITEDSFTLFSVGPDGQPGGNDDVFHDRPLTPPSLHRFTFELPTHAVRWVSALTGLGAAVLVFRTRSGVRGLALQAAATTGGALFVAFVLSFLHIPSGH